MSPAAGSEDALEALPDPVASVLNGLPEMISYWDSTHINRLANDAYTDFYGVTPQDLYGTHLRDLVGVTVYEKNLPYLDAALTGRPQQFDRLLTDRHGALRSMQITYTPDLRDGSVAGVFVSVSDVSARVAAQRALVDSVEQYRALTRNLPSGWVLLFDRALRILLIDGVDLTVFGFRRSELEGRSIHETLSPELAAELEPRWRTALAGERVSWERHLGPRTFRLTATPVVPGDGPVVSGMVLATEVTEERFNQRSWAALHSIALDVARKLSPEQVSHRVAEALVDLFHVESSAIAKLIGPSRIEMVARASHAAQPAGTEVTLQPGERTATAAMLATGEPALVEYGENDGPLAERMRARGLVAAAAAPIRLNGEIWGMVSVMAASTEVLSEATLPRLAAFADLVELAIVNTEAWGTLAHDAATDELTGLPNRRTFMTSLRSEVQRARRHDRALSVAMMDLDHFKRVNDDHGHPVGDRVLAELGRRLREAAREGEMVARLGGEEFAWLLPEADEETACDAADRLRRTLGQVPFAEVGALTISIGVCGLGAHDNPVDRLLSGADEALYAAKTGGRDRVVARGDLP